jgi:hypothetical protein
LSFVELSREGLFPHDLAREALVADLRWRNPDWNMELHHPRKRQAANPKRNSPEALSRKASEICHFGALTDGNRLHKIGNR